MQFTSLADHERDAVVADFNIGDVWAANFHHDIIAMNAGMRPFRRLFPDMVVLVRIEYR